MKNSCPFFSNTTCTNHFTLFLQNFNVTKCNFIKKYCYNNNNNNNKRKMFGGHCPQSPRVLPSMIYAGNFYYFGGYKEGFCYLIYNDVISSVYY